MSRIIVIGGHVRTGIRIVATLLVENRSVVATIPNVKHMADLGAEMVMIDLQTSPGH